MAIVGIAEAARALDLSASTIRRDIQLRGAAGVVRPGSSGRGCGARLDLERYARWRAGMTDAHDTLALVADVLARVVREGGGDTRALRLHSQFLAVAFFVRLHQALLRDEPAELPAELRAACAVLAESSALPTEELLHVRTGHR